MTPTHTARQVPPVAQIYQLVRRLEDSRGNRRSTASRWRAIANRLVFEADIRFEDFRLASDSTPMIERLANWLSNASTDSELRGLLTVLDNFLFIDRSQMDALYRAAFRGPITRWLSSDSDPPEFLLDSSFERNIRMRADSVQFASITDSFQGNLFLRSNNLSGSTFPLDVPRRARAALIRSIPIHKHAVAVLEDFVGTGNTAVPVLDALASSRRRACRKILFVPLVVMERGLEFTRESIDPAVVTISPLMVLPNRECVGRHRQDSEPASHSVVRRLVRSTAARVCEPNGVDDTPPESPFGYEESGLLYASCQNTPDNTLPLIHHEAREWNPLFNRVHR